MLRPKVGKIPTKKERENVIKSIRKISKKYEKNKKKSKEKGKQHSDLTDNPNLSQALKSQYADDWTKAINVELQQMKTENVYVRQWLENAPSLESRDLLALMQQRL